MAEVENLCDRIAILSGGRIAFSGTVEQLGKTVGKHYNITIQTETGTGKYESDNIGETLLTLLVQCREKGDTLIQSIIVFLPSIMLSGIMFPVEMLPQMLETIGKAFPASWGYRLMTGGTFGLENLLPMLVIFVLAVCACAILLSGKMIWRNK